MPLRHGGQCTHTSSLEASNVPSKGVSQENENKDCTKCSTENQPERGKGSRGRSGTERLTDGGTMIRAGSWDITGGIAFTLLCIPASQPMLSCMDHHVHSCPHRGLF